MKGITKDWKIVFLYSKINVKKKKIALHLRIYISFSQYWPWVSCIYDILAIFRLSCKISHMKDTYQKISRIYLHFYHHVTTYFSYAHVVYFHSKYLKKGSFVKSIYRRSKTYLKWFFFVYTLNSKGGVLCSARVSKAEKISRNSLLTGHAISGVELNNYVINIDKLWEVSTSLVILYYFLL